MVFDPDYKNNGYFFVYYSTANPRCSVVSRFSVSQTNPNLADAGSEIIVLDVAQPYGNHNGGQLAFGPDGYLYVGLGDGGGGGDPMGNGQNTSTLLGPIIRIDISGGSGKKNYSVPTDNPFVGIPGARDEIWAYGLRNPWRFSFDSGTGMLWAGDVGQNNWEEVDIIKKGSNYGWNLMEGAHCFSPSTGCDTDGLELPVIEYDHDEGCSITGGYVYRGPSIPSLQGAYVFGDFCSGTVWGLRHNAGVLTEHMMLADSGLALTSYGQDQSGNLYILSRNDGIYQLLATE